MVLQAPEEFLRRVPRTLPGDQFGTVQREMAPQLLPERSGQVRHLLPVARPVDIEPFQQLEHTVRRAGPRLEKGLQFIGCVRPDVRQHPRA